jgi:hypothetical protein
MLFNSHIVLQLAVERQQDMLRAGRRARRIEQEAPAGKDAGTASAELRMEMPDPLTEPERLALRQAAPRSHISRRGHGSSAHSRPRQRIGA